MPDSIKHRFKKLVIHNKLILIGSFLAVLSVFLPWYSDIDKFNTGDTYLGITGPLYLTGLIVLISAGTSLSILLMKILNRPVPKLPVTVKQFHVFSGVVNIFMLVLAASVFFHSKFGINITDKSAGIGMIMAFIGSFGILVPGILILKKKQGDFEEEGHMKPLIDIDERRQKAIYQDMPDTTEIKSAVQESLEDFTSGAGEPGATNTNDVYPHDRRQ